MRGRRVVLTGVGVVNAALTGGSGALGAWLAAPAPAPRDARGVVALAPSALAGLVDEGEARRLSRVCRLTLAAARLALADAGLDPAPGLALVVGTELGDLGSTLGFADGFLARGPAGLSALLFPNTVMNTMAATTAIGVGARELALTVNAPGIAGGLAVARAVAAVATGRVDAALAGGVDEVAALVGETLAALGAPGGEARGEGAAFCVLEEEGRARARGATILGAIPAAASGALPARPGGVGRARRSRAVAAALAAAGAAGTDLGWVYASASGDAARDRWEASVLAAALGDAALPAAALAGFLGHSAAIGALGVAAAAWTARSGLLPAPGGPRRVARRRGLVHGVARGGGHVALVVEAA
jgi:3-oxoacyl-(acyl-carrier-protein) synthase